MDAFSLDLDVDFSKMDYGNLLTTHVGTDMGINFPEEKSRGEDCEGKVLIYYTELWNVRSSCATHLIPSFYPSHPQQIRSFTLHRTCGNVSKMVNTQSHRISI